MFLLPPKKSFNPTIHHLSVTPANLPQVTRRPSKPKKLAFKSQSLRKGHYPVTRKRKQVRMHTLPCQRCSAQRAHGCGNDRRSWHASPLHFIEKDPAELGAHKTQGSKTGQLSNNSTQWIPEERVHCGVESSTYLILFLVISITKS